MRNLGECSGSLGRIRGTGASWRLAKAGTEAPAAAGTSFSIAAVGRCVVTSCRAGSGMHLPALVAVRLASSNSCRRRLAVASAASLASTAAAPHWRHVLVRLLLVLFKCAWPKAARGSMSPQREHSLCGQGAASFSRPHASACRSRRVANSCSSVALASSSHQVWNSGCMRSVECGGEGTPVMSEVMSAPCVSIASSAPSCSRPAAAGTVLSSTGSVPEAFAAISSVEMDMCECWCSICRTNSVMSAVGSSCSAQPSYICVICIESSSRLPARLCSYLARTSACSLGKPWSLRRSVVVSIGDVGLLSARSLSAPSGTCRIHTPYSLRNGRDVGACCGWTSMRSRGRSCRSIRAATVGGRGGRYAHVRSSCIVLVRSICNARAEVGQSRTRSQCFSRCCMSKPALPLVHTVCSDNFGTSLPWTVCVRFARAGMCRQTVCQKWRGASSGDGAAEGGAGVVEFSGGAGPRTWKKSWIVLFCSMACARGRPGRPGGPSAPVSSSSFPSVPGATSAEGEYCGPPRRSSLPVLEVATQRSTASQSAVVRS